MKRESSCLPPGQGDEGHNQLAFIFLFSKIGFVLTVVCKRKQENTLKMNTKTVCKLAEEFWPLNRCQYDFSVEK